MSSLNEIVLKMPGNTRITITNKANAADAKNARLISNVNPKIIVGVIMKEIDNEELEYFIRDWHWDKKSHKFAQETGKFLFQFIDALEEEGLSERTIRKHIDNCWSIGILECEYGYHKNFSPNIFICEEASYLYEFKRKHSDSKNAIGSYKATWRKLAKYVKSLGYKEAD